MNYIDHKKTKHFIMEEDGILSPFCNCARTASVANEQINKNATPCPMAKAVLVYCAHTE